MSNAEPTTTRVFRTLTARKSLPTRLPSTTIPDAMIAQARDLGIINGNHPVIGWTWFSARRGSYGIRFFPVGAPVVVQDLGDVMFVPALVVCV